MTPGEALVGAAVTLVIGILLHTYQHWLKTGSIRPIDSIPNANATSRARERADRRDRIVGTFIGVLQAGALMLAAGKIQVDHSTNAPITRWSVAAIGLAAAILWSMGEQLYDRLTVDRPAARLRRADDEERRRVALGEDGERVAGLVARLNELGDRLENRPRTAPRKATKPPPPVE